MRRRLLELAVKAPSSHNTQPWLFQIDDAGISLFADRTRALPVNDPDDRELTISCGCALMNLRVAAAAEGLGLSISILPEPGEEDLLARITFDASGDADKSLAGLPDAIETRRTYRKKFESKEIPQPVIAELHQTADKERAWLQIFTGGPDRQAIAALVSEGDGVQWANASWRRELAAWMHPRRRGDGLTVPGLVAPLARLIVRSFDMGNGVAARDRQLAEQSPFLALLGTREDNPADWLQAGQALQRVLLVAASKGLQASYLNQPIQVARLRPKLQELADSSGHPQILLCLGYPREELPASPRRPIEAVVEK